MALAEARGLSVVTEGEQAAGASGAGGIAIFRSVTNRIAESDGSPKEKGVTVFQ